jgi:hypothetical protein
MEALEGLGLLQVNDHDVVNIGSEPGGIDERGRIVGMHNRGANEGCDQGKALEH